MVYVVGNTKQMRELYDNVNDEINSTTPTHKELVARGLTRIDNIFNSYAGITLQNRAFAAPVGTVVFKAVGEVIGDGTFRANQQVDLKAATDAKDPPTRAPSPAKTTGFPPASSGLNSIRGTVSPTSPIPKEIIFPGMPWPTNNPVGDVRVGDASVRPPSNKPTPGRASAAQPRRWANEHATQPRLNDNIVPISTDVDDIVLGRLPRPATLPTLFAGGWTIRTLDSASREITKYLRHGEKNNAMNYHSTDGYVPVKIFLQLPRMRTHVPPIDKTCLELVLMLYELRISTDNDCKKIRAVQGHTMTRFEPGELYTKIENLAEFNDNSIWGGNPPDHLVVEFYRENDLASWMRLSTLCKDRDLR